MRLALAPLLPALAASAALPALADSPPPSEQLKHPTHADVEITGHVLEPRSLEPSDERIAGLRLPEGFAIGRFAQGLEHPRMLAVDGERLYVTSRSAGRVVMLRDGDGDGRAEERRVVAEKPSLHGIWIEDGTAWLATVNEVYRADVEGDGDLGPLERIVEGLPEAGQHPNRMVALGPDGRLYISVGSTCNACGETSPQNATILQAGADGSGLKIFASGLRNTIGFGWHPETGQLWGMDHGIDWLGDREQVEELNRIEEGKRYGWPYVYGDGKYNPQDEPPGDTTMAEWAARSEAPVIGYTPHAAPMQLAFHHGGGLPADYRGDAFVAMRGSWNRRPPSGYEVLRIDFDESGEPQGFEPFLTGFLVEQGDGSWGQFARLAGLAIDAEGALYLADDSGGVIYRVTYQGDRAQAGASADALTAAGSPAGPEPASTAAPSPSGESVEEITAAGSPAGPEPASVAAADAGAGALAIERLAPEAERFKVTSPAFEDGAAIPRRFAAERDDVSPPLSWWGAPKAAPYFAILVEDPDAPGATPFLHWSLVNLPWTNAGLAQGLSSSAEVPKVAVEGTNSAGSLGWFGMKPPPGDGPHRYHFQVFALDRKLDLKPGASREEILEAMDGHVIAAGELVGTYDRGS